MKLHGENQPLQIALHMGTRTNEQVRERIKSIKRGLGIHVKSVGKRFAE